LPHAALRAEPSLADELKRLPPVEPADALGTFKVQHGFSLELVAHEPLVADPVDACFDEHGRLFVAEMHGYPYSPEPREMQPEPLGKKDACLIRLLEDTDGNGTFDRSTVFADKLNWALSVCCCDGGVFALAPPHLYFFKDTTGDGVADVRETVLSGFSRYNVQGLANNLKWGLDNRIHGSGGTNSDTELTRDGKAVGNLRGRNFAFDPKSREVEFLSGGQQFGHSFDDWGNVFVCSNSNHIQHVVFPLKYLDRTPGVSVSGVIRSIAKEGPAAPVFRTSPPEPWRIVRTRRRAADPDYRKRLPATELVATGFFTSATGVTIYRGDAYPPEFRGNAFIGDVGGNLVHRKTLTRDDGVSFVAARADEGVEFLTSTDTWFRPVNFVTGPDGCLYILDMYRETIEHPSSIPEDIKAHLDLYSGDDRGRIYRLVPPVGVPFSGGGRRLKPELQRASAAELVSQLQSANSWRRETAQRLLWERQDQTAVQGLRKILATSAFTTARLHALHALDGLNALTTDDLRTTLADDAAAIRVHSIRLAESHAERGQLLTELLELAHDADVAVQFQLALSVGELDERTAAAVLTELGVRRDLDGDVRRALLTSVRDGALTLAMDAIGRWPAVPSAGNEPWVRDLCQLLGSGADAGPVIALLNAFAERSVDDLRTDVALEALGSGLRRRGRSVASVLDQPGVSAAARELVLRRYSAAAELAVESAADAARIPAIRLLAGGPEYLLARVAEDLLTPRTSQDVQMAVARALADHPRDNITDSLLARWPTLSPAVRSEALDGLLRSTGRIRKLLSAVADQTIKLSEIAPDKRQTLLNHPNTDVRALAAKLLGTTSADRSAVIAKFEPALEADPSAERGRAVFRQHCANCHKVGDEGHAVGPDLASVKNKSSRDMLISILDPNREAQPNYTSYTALLDDGRVVTGIITAETATSVTFRRAEGKEDAVLREQIEQLKSDGVSLMPVGMERNATPEELADVIAFVRGLGQ
jgi:putative membrane-bound dehydrogenase-like protein